MYENYEMDYKYKTLGSDFGYSDDYEIEVTDLNLHKKTFYQFPVGVGLIFNYVTNTWTGIQEEPDDDSMKNQTTFICLLKKYKFPKDAMTIINQFLNWVPAGCWKKHEWSTCVMCYNPVINNSIMIHNTMCSNQCLELMIRNEIINRQKIEFDNICTIKY